MKKLGIIIFVATIVVGVVIANFFSFGNSFIKSPISLSFGKVQGSGNHVTEKRTVSNFKKIEVSGVFVVEVTAQKEFGIEIEADDNLLPLIKTEVNGDTLSIERDKRFSTNNSVVIRVSAPDIESLDVSGVSKVSLSNIENESLKVDTSGASKITVDGKTNRLVIDSSGASRIDARKLSTENVTVDASGATKSMVNVSETLSVDLSGASRVTYSGNPSKVNKKTSGVSSLKQNK
jgi:hypothetical protein